RELGRALFEVLGEEDALELAGCDPARLGQRATEHAVRPDGDVVEGRQVIEEIEALEDEADAPALARQLALGERPPLSVTHLAADRLVTKDDGPGRGSFSTSAAAQ